MTIIPALLLSITALASTADTDEAVARGRSLLLEVAQAYQVDTELIDRISLETHARGLSIMEGLEVSLGANETGRVRWHDAVAVIDGDWASVTHNQNDGTYFVAEADATFYATLLGILPLGTSLVPQYGLRLAEDEDMAVAAFAAGWDDEVEVTGCADTEINGVPFVEVTLAHTDGTETIVIDPTTKRLATRTLAQDDFTTRIQHAIQSGNTRAENYAFDPGERKLSGDLLEVLSLRAGEQAPPFAAPDLDGDLHTLADLHKDGIVVLDFWATWCRPCVKGLKRIQAFVDEQAENNTPVRIVAINVSEELDGAERFDLVSSFWADAGYTFDVLVDEDDAIRRAYRAFEIPLTLIIDRRGRIHDIADESEDLQEWLPTATKEAAAAGS